MKYAFQIVDVFIRHAFGRNHWRFCLTRAGISPGIKRLLRIQFRRNDFRPRTNDSAKRTFVSRHHRVRTQCSKFIERG